MTRWQFSIKFFFAGPHLKLNKLNNPQQAARYLNSALRFVLKSSPPNVFIGGPVPNPPGFPPKDGCAEGRIRPKPCGESVQSFVADPLKACRNDGLVGELRLGSKTCSIFIVCGRA